MNDGTHEKHGKTKEAGQEARFFCLMPASSFYLLLPAERALPVPVVRVPVFSADVVLPVIPDVLPVPVDSVPSPEPAVIVPLVPVVVEPVVDRSLHEPSRLTRMRFSTLLTPFMSSAMSSASRFS